MLCTCCYSEESQSIWVCWIYSKKNPSRWMFKKYSLIHSIVIDWHSSYTIMKHKSAFTDRYSNRSQEQRYCLCLRPMHERHRSLQRSLKPWKFHSDNRLWTFTFTINDSTYQHHVLVISESKWWKQSNSERNEGLFFNSSTRFTYHNHLSDGWPLKLMDYIQWPQPQISYNFQIYQWHLHVSLKNSVIQS